MRLPPGFLCNTNLRILIIMVCFEDSKNKEFFEYLLIIIFLVFQSLDSLKPLHMGYTKHEEERKPVWCFSLAPAAPGRDVSST